jgi:anion-transporting  ArsA/GET3 family ATPase
VLFRSASFRVANLALQAFFRSVSKIIGTEVVEDLVLFFQAFEGMEEGFRQRAQRVMDLLTDKATAFVLVTAPARDAVSEAGYFADRLEAAGLKISALVVNRIHPDFGATSDGYRPDGAHGAAAGAELLAELYANLGDFVELSKRESGHLEGLERSVGAVPVVKVPLLEVEVCDIASLTEVGQHLLGAASGGPTAGG